MSKKIIVALDLDNINKAVKIVKELKKEAYAFKIGHEFFYNFGINGYLKIYNICPKIFLDLKLHDIPNTVQKGLKAILKLNPIFTTIHISGGDEMQKISALKNNIYPYDPEKIQASVFSQKDIQVISLPGVPYEMKSLMNNSILPELKLKFKRPFIYNKTLLTYGLGESAIANRIKDWENKLPKNLKFAYSCTRVRRSRAVVGGRLHSIAWMT